MSLPVKGCFITGTDTGVGKTLIACALLDAMASRGMRCAGMKPVAAGARIDAGRWVNEDALELMRHASVRVPYEMVNPYVFAAPVAPHIAARDAGERIDIGVIVSRFEALCARAERVVVEGAGGFLVPLGNGADGAELARCLGLPVILVVGLRLGCLNHARLAAEAIRARGLRLVGWVGNAVDPEMARREDNLEYLRTALPAPCLGLTDWMPEKSPHERVISAASALDFSKLEFNQINDFN